MLSKIGATQSFSSVWTPEQNGISKRANRTILDLCRTILIDSSLPKFLWGEIISTIVQILNITTICKGTNKSAYETMLGRKPYLERLHPIGTKCFVLDEKRSQDKLAPRSIEGKLEGYSNEGRGYRIFTSDPPKVHASKNVRFPDPNFPKDPDKIEQSKSEDDPAVVTNEEEDDKDENEPTEAYNASRELHNRDNFNKPVDAYSAQADDGPRKLVEPTTYEEAMNSPEKEQWLDSMISEVNSLKMHDTSEVVDLPPNHRAIGLKWVYRAKLKETGEIDKLKSRVVALGYRQRAGIDYDELFSPTARFESLRTILSIASAEKLELLQADVTSAFLNAELKETVYVTQIPGFEDSTNRVLELRKCLYGFKQSPRTFHLKLRYERQTFTLAKHF